MKIKHFTMNTVDGDTLYVFIDESGDMNFQENGTKFFVFAALSTTNPLLSSNILQGLKYDLLCEGEGGTDFQHFHATQDSQSIRNRVFDGLNKMKDVSVNRIWAEKSKAHPSKRSRSDFYNLLAGALAKYILQKNWYYNRVVIIFDRALNKKEEKAFLGEIKPQLKKINVKYAIYFHHTYSDFNGQIADYFAWAKYVSLERNELRPLAQISSIKTEDFNIFRNNTNVYD